MHQIGLRGRHNPRRRIAQSCPTSARCDLAHGRTDHRPRQKAVSRPWPALRAVDGPSIPSRSAPDATTNGRPRLSEKSWISPRNQRFTSPAFARDQHGQRGIHHPRHKPVKTLHRRCAPHQAAGHRLASVCCDVARVVAARGALSRAPALPVSLDRADQRVWADNRKHPPQPLGSQS